MFNTKMCDLYSKQMEYCERKNTFYTNFPTEHLKVFNSGSKCLCEAVYHDQYVSISTEHLVNVKDVEKNKDQKMISFDI